MTANRFTPFGQPSTSDGPVGEVPPMDEFGALRAAESSVHAAIRQVGSDIHRDRDAVVYAAKDLRRLELAGVDVDSDVYIDAMQRLRDAVDRLPIVFDIRGALIENRRAEVQRFWQDGDIIAGGA